MKKSIVSIACLAASGIAFAAAPMQPMSSTKLGWYVGVGLNYTGITATRFEPDQNRNVNQYTYKQDHAQIGYNLLFGNRLSKHFGTEAGYAYIGNTRYQDNADHDARIETINNYNLYWTGIAYMPLNQGVHQFELLANGGLALMHVKNQYNTNAVTSSHGDNYSNALSSFAFKYGAGVQYNYRQFSVRGTYEHVQPSNYHNNLFIIPDTVNLDLMYSFG